MEILSPKLNSEHPDYQLSCEEALDPALRDIIDIAIGSGWAPRIVFNAIQSIAINQALAYEEDPDPVSDLK